MFFFFDLLYCILDTLHAALRRVISGFLPLEQLLDTDVYFDRKTESLLYAYVV